MSRRRAQEGEQQPKASRPKSKRTKKAVVDITGLDPFFERDPDKLMGDRKRPKGWEELSFEEKLEYIATRILAEDRHGVTSHKALKETGILSSSQYERRRNREVYSQFGSLDEIKPSEGSFSRAHTRDIRGYKTVREWEKNHEDQPVKVSKVKPTKKKSNTKKATTKKATVKKAASNKKSTKKTVAKKKPTKRTKKT